MAKQMYACKYVCMNVYKYVCTDVRLFICMHASYMYDSMNVYMDDWMYACKYAFYYKRQILDVL